MRFELNTPARIVFGPGVWKEAGSIAAAFGQRALVVTGVGAADPVPLVSVLHERGIATELYTVQGEPTLALIEEGTRQALALGCDLVIGLGGGSVMDTAKAIAVMATNPGELVDYLEVIGKGQSLGMPGLPVIALPTTSGTGAEVTRNAVLTAPASRMKVSLRSSYLLPRVALVDPDLTLSVPPGVTASTGMDALVQLIEPYVTPRANPITDAFCRDGVVRVARSLLRAYQHGDDRAAREDMSLASLLGGLSLANAGLGAVHGYASPIGGMFNAPHGAVCARLLPPVMAVNQRALAERQPDSPALSRYQEVVRWLTGNPKATLVDGTAWADALCREMAIPGLSTYGLTRADIPLLVEKGKVASSMKANPIQLTEAELTEILELAL